MTKISLANSYNFLNELERLLELANISGYKSLESLLFLAELVRNRKPKHILELGTLYGCSTVFMARASEAKITSIDSFQTQLPYKPPASLSHAKKVMRDFFVDHKVNVIQGDTRKAGELIIEEVDFVFFDASHTDDDLLSEWESLKPKLSSPAMLVIDDAMCTTKAVIKMGINHVVMKSFPIHYGLVVIET